MAADSHGGEMAEAEWSLRQIRACHYNDIKQRLSQKEQKSKECRKCSSRLWFEVSSARQSVIREADIVQMCFAEQRRNNAATNKRAITITTKTANIYFRIWKSGTTEVEETPTQIFNNIS